MLAAVGRRLAETLRATDVRCRYGGDEFLVILPDTPQRGAQHVAEMIRRDVASLPFHGGDQRVTISVGVAAVLPDDDDAATMIARADAALYCAKNAGRNRVAVAPAGAGAEPSRPQAQRVAFAG